MERTSRALSSEMDVLDDRDRRNFGFRAERRRHTSNRETDKAKTEAEIQLVADLREKSLFVCGYPRISLRTYKFLLFFFFYFIQASEKLQGPPLRYYTSLLFSPFGVGGFAIERRRKFKFFFCLN